MRGEMTNKNGTLYCVSIDSWCANALNCDRINCMSNEKAPTETAISDVGANQNNLLQDSTTIKCCQGGKDGDFK